MSEGQPPEASFDDYEKGRSIITPDYNSSTGRSPSGYRPSGVSRPGAIELERGEDGRITTTLACDRKGEGGATSDTPYYRTPVPACFSGQRGKCLQSTGGGTSQWLLLGRGERGGCVSLMRDQL